MKFQNVYIENEVQNHHNTKYILKQLPGKIPIRIIDQYDKYFGKVRKPYLQKRDNLNLFIARKKGQLVKEAPPAYGTKNAKHFYFIHQYNCIYECEYCYLQGHFHSPDIVFFINHDEIIAEMKSILNQYPDQEVWFHGGEFSDSLALTNLTNELPQYFEFFSDNPNVFFEIRTKSNNIDVLKSLTPKPNIIISFSLSPETNCQSFDKKVPPLKARLKAIESLVLQGYKIGLHFDPIIFTDDLVPTYKNLVQSLSKILPNKSLHYISIGVVRFPKDILFQVQNNYPHSKIHDQEFIKGSDNKLKYPRPMRNWIFNEVESILENFFDNEKIYRCMED